MKAAHGKAIECRNLALPYLNPRASASRCRTKANGLPGSCANLRASSGRRCWFRLWARFLQGGDRAYEQPLLARGIATLVFDGPGQGEGEYDFAIRGDYEVAVKAVIDFIETRRTSMLAHRLGRHQPRRLLRAARGGFEKRIKACLALGGPYDWVEAGIGCPNSRARRFACAAKTATLEEARKRAATLSLKGVAEQYHLPDLHHERQA